MYVEQAGHEHMSDEYKRSIYCSIAEAHTLGTKYTKDHHMVPTTEPTLTIYVVSLCANYLHFKDASPAPI